MPFGSIPVSSKWVATGRTRPAIRFGFLVTIEIEERCSTGGTRGGDIVWTGEDFRWRYARPRDLHLLFAMPPEEVRQ